MFSISLCSVILETLDNFFFLLQFSIQIMDGFGLIKTSLVVNFFLVRVKSLTIASVDHLLYCHGPLEICGQQSEKHWHRNNIQTGALSDGNFHPMTTTDRETLMLMTYSNGLYFICTGFKHVRLGSVTDSTFYRTKNDQ